MSPTTNYVPLTLPHTFQDPQSRSDRPASSGDASRAPASGAPSVGASTTGVPTTGTVVNPNPEKQPEPAGPCAGGEMMYMMPLFLVLMYFMMIRPEQKRKKEQVALLAAIKVGEAVVMLSGMHGVVTALDDKTVTIRAGDASITFDRSSVARIVREDATATTGA